MDKPNANDNPMAELAQNQDKVKTRQRDDLSTLVHGCTITTYHPGSDLILKKAQKSIKSVGLLDFLKELGFLLEIAKYYFHEVHVYNKSTHEEQKTLGFPNVDDGFELINPFFKGTLGERDISFVRGIIPKPEVVYIFVNSLDFLSFLSKINGKRIIADVIILHSHDFLENIRPYIRGFGYKRIYSWMENDKTGAEAKEFINRITEDEEDLKHKAMNNLYKPYNNLYSWYKQHLSKVI